MDFSVILVLPFAALIAFVACIGAAVASRTRPRLIWPFALSVLATAPVFVGLPSASMLGFWALALFGLAVWAAMGTVVGAMVAKAAIFVARHLRSN